VTLRSIFTRTATIALAAAALAAPTASARPADMPPANANANAATAAQHEQAKRSADVGDYPTRPAQGEQANPRPDATTTTATTPVAERDIAWTTIGIGLAGSLLALSAIAGIVRHTRRSGRARITA
jgi:hypothetical protein